MLTQATPTFIAGEAIPAGSRVKFALASAITVMLAGANDPDIGTAILHGGKDSYASGSAVGVKLNTEAGSRTLVASGAITEGAKLYRAASGAVSVLASSGEFYGVAGEASGDTDAFEGFRLDGLSAGPGLAQVKLAHAVFNPSANAGERTIGAHGLGVTLPDDAIITRAFYEVETTFTSATDAATLALHANAADDLLAAVAISAAVDLDAGLKALKPGYPALGVDAAHDTAPEVGALFAGTFIKLTAARELTATVAVEALLTGKLTVFVEYLQGS